MAHASNPTLVRAFDSAAIADAAALIAAGQPVAVPTETVYGLAVGAPRIGGEAVDRLGRHRDRLPGRDQRRRLGDRSAIERANECGI